MSNRGGRGGGGGGGGGGGRRDQGPRFRDRGHRGNKGHGPGPGPFMGPGPRGPPGGPRPPRMGGPPPHGMGGPEPLLGRRSMMDDMSLHPFGEEFPPMRPPRMAPRVLVGNLPMRILRKDLEQRFGRYGPIVGEFDRFDEFLSCPYPN